METLNKTDIIVYVCLALILSFITLIGSVFVSVMLIIYISIYLHKKEKKVYVQKNNNNI